MLCSPSYKVALLVWAAAATRTSTLVSGMATSSFPTSSSSGSQQQQQQPQQGQSQEELVNLLELASAALACSVTASRSIRQIAQPENGDAHQKNTRLKEDGSFVTDADFAAQGVIAQAMRSVHASLKVMGEESPEEMAQHAPKEAISADDLLYLQKAQQEIRLRYHRQTVQRPPLAAEEPTEPEDTPVSNGGDSPATTVEDPVDCFVDPSRICVIVDPLDGTKSYAHGDYDSVSVLIGIILDNRPVFGVIGKPFGYTGVTSILDTPCAAIYGGSLIHGAYVAGGSKIELNPIPPGKLPRAVISESRSKGVVHDFCIHLGERGLIDPDPMRISGAGEKSLRVLLARDREALWFFPKRGTFLWDVAAPDALLQVMGGRMTDKYGKVMDYSKSREEAENVDGVVAAVDPELHEIAIRLFKEGDWEGRQ